MGDHTIPTPGTPLPWAYRPQEYDDWGIIRTAEVCDDGYRAHVCRVNCTADQEVLGAHRVAKTDPCEQDAAYIVTACNLFPELVEALSEAVDVFDGMCDDEINEELMPRLRAVLAKAGA